MHFYRNETPKLVYSTFFFIHSINSSQFRPAVLQFCLNLVLIGADLTYKDKNKCTEFQSQLCLWQTTPFLKLNRLYFPRFKAESYMH